MSAHVDLLEFLAARPSGRAAWPLWLRHRGPGAAAAVLAAAAWGHVADLGHELQLMPQGRDILAPAPPPAAPLPSPRPARGGALTPGSWSWAGRARWGR